jgi:hypothetical protein
MVKHFGGGEFYLHLNQIDWIGQRYYGSKPSPFHQGRMTMKDFEFMESFMLAQEYISKFEPMDPKNTMITHNLDDFRAPFVGHPGNYVDVYSTVYNITDPVEQTRIRTTPWLTVPNPKRHGNRTVVINRTSRWLPPELSSQWIKWSSEGIQDIAVFLGLPEEYEAFKTATGWDIPYQPTTSMLELAEYIAGADMFIGNQSVALSMAIGLGQEYWCEARRDLPLERNECYFPDQPKGNYF